MLDEFALINKYFAPFSQQIGDDCAIVEIERGARLATSVDALVEDVHFPAAAPPDQLAYLAVVAALSDLAAMGAEARAILLALTLPARVLEEGWLRQFSHGLGQATTDYAVELIGGNTSSGALLTITVQVLGTLPPQQALTRANARVGDRVFISGTPGDAAAARALIREQWPGSPRYEDYLLQRRYRPTARIELGRGLLGLASSAIDVSDGLLADANHICEQSAVGINIDVNRIPLSPALQSIPDQAQAKRWALSGGGDYELLFTVPPERVAEAPDSCACIGEVIAGDSAHTNFAVRGRGYNHFAPGPG